MPCDDAYVFGYIFTDSDKLTCRLEEFVITLQGERRPIGTHHIKAGLETMIEAVCPLNQIRSRRSLPEPSFVTGYTISVSNDGSNYENGTDLFVFNSRCQEMRNDSNTLKFVLKVGFCYIDGLCVSDGATHTRDSCSVCDVNTNAIDWSTQRRPECEPDVTSTQPSKTAGIVSPSDVTLTRPAKTAGIVLTSDVTSTRPSKTAGIVLQSDVTSSRPAKTAGIVLTSDVTSTRPSETAGIVLPSDVTLTRPSKTADIVSPSDVTSTRPKKTAGIVLPSDVTSTRPAKTADIVLHSDVTSTRPSKTAGIVLPSDETSTHPSNTAGIVLPSDVTSSRAPNNARITTSPPNDKRDSQKEEKDDPSHKLYLWVIGVVVVGLICIVIGVVVVIRLYIERNEVPNNKFSTRGSNNDIVFYKGKQQRHSVLQGEATTTKYSTRGSNNDMVFYTGY